MSKKLQEKQARRAAEEQRRREQQRAARRRNLVTLGIALVVIVAVITAITFQRQSETEQGSGVSADAANCSDIERPEDEGRGHVDEGQPVNYGTSPPTSGQHWGTPAEPGFFTPDAAAEAPPERAVHNLEHGQIVIWYSPNAPQGVIDDIESYVDSQSGDQSIALVAAPYEAIPGGSNLVLTAWTASQSCERFSGAVADEFRDRFQGRGPEQVGVPTFSSSGQ